MNAEIELLSPPAPAGVQADYAVSVIHDRDDLADLTDAWQALGTQAGGPIEHHEWAAAILETARELDSPSVVAVNSGEQLVALAALEIKRLAGVRRQLMLGESWHREPMDLLARDEVALQHLAHALAKTRWPYVLGRLPAESNSVLALRAAFAGRAKIIERPQAATPFIPLDASWKQPEQHLNSGRRSDLRRAQRRAEKLGSVKAEVLSPAPHEVSDLLDEAFEVEARSWKGREGTALACDPLDAAFCRAYALGASRTGILRICRLQIDAQTVAVQIAMQQAGAFWLLKIGYDAEFAACSPGMLMLREAIAHAARAGLRSFEFLGQSESWIETWTSHKRQCVALRIYPYNLHGAAALAADGAVMAGRVAREQGQQWAIRGRALVKRCALPVVRRAARNYIAGETVADALRVVRQLNERGLRATIGFWDTEQQGSREVADQYLAGLAGLAGDEQGTNLSIKLPSLRYSPELLGEVISKGQTVGRRIHFDAMAPDSAERTRAMIDEVLAARPGIDLGVTLPGRWKRSLDDAPWAAQRQLYVRVVKGEWADPLDPRRDLRSGFLETIDRLAGKAQAVGVATHDPGLAAEAIGRLQAAGTPCCLELLYGLPMRAQLAVARRMGVPAQVYVPYGEAYMPYALSQIRRKPRVLWWLLRDLAASWWG